MSEDGSVFRIKQIAILSDTHNVIPLHFARVKGLDLTLDLGCLADTSILLLPGVPG